jgi:hypothetical protein
MIRSFSIGLALALGFGLTSLAQVPGCTNILACNFDFLATQDDGSCNFCCEGNVDLSGIGPTFCGCTDPLACNWDPFANLDDASCQYCCPLSNDTIQVFSSGGSQTSPIPMLAIMIRMRRLTTEAATFCVSIAKRERFGMTVFKAAS